VLPWLDAAGGFAPLGDYCPPEKLLESSIANAQEDYRRVPKGKKQKHEETIMDHGWLRNPAPVKVPCKHPLKNLIIYL
jgi:hypothetical protein